MIAKRIYFKIMISHRKRVTESFSRTPLINVNANSTCIFLFH